MDWIFDELKEKAAGDIYAARSWLLVTKCLFPQSFRVLFEAYKLEKAEKNVEQCAALLNEMFRNFPDEYLLNKEIELMVMDTGNDKEAQSLSTAIFNQMPLEIQESILIYSAERQTDINMRCKLTLTAMQKSPKDAMRHGIPLSEKLVNDEKVEGYTSPVNKCRKLLVCDVLPAICQAPVSDLSPKQFYKWLQKAIEFYVAYNTAPSNTVIGSIGKLTLSWSDLETLRNQIGKHCDWEPFSDSDCSLVNRMKFINEMHRLSRKDVIGNINKRQIFYTSVLLLLESSIRFTNLLDTSFFDPKAPSTSIYVVSLQPSLDNETKSTSPSLSSLNDVIREHYQVARSSWIILQSNESFSKDLNHLIKRWKMDKWAWFQLFLCMYHLQEKDYNNAIMKLQKLLDQNWNGIYQYVHLRCLCLLISAYQAIEQETQACKCIINCVRSMEQSKISRNIPNNKIERIPCFDAPDGRSFILTPLSFSQLGPFWIHILITSLTKKIKATSCGDETLGHLIVLCQHGWPKWREVCGSVLSVISRHQRFSYPVFFDYVVISDILEEIAMLWNSDGGTILTLYHGAFTNQQRVTRGVNKGTAEEFHNAISRQMDRGEDELEDILVRFLLEQENSIMDCLYLETAMS